MADRVAWVTGAGAGIGRAIALRLARAGAAVAVIDLVIAAAEETAALVRDAGGEAIAIAADVADEAAVAAAITRTTGEWGRLDWAVNNAGVSGGTPIMDDWADDVWERAIAVNLRGTMYCMKHQIGWMTGAGGGSIVNIASIAGLVGVGGLAYTATKHGIVGMSKAAGARYMRQGVRINAVCPGTIRTAMIERLDERSPGALARLIEAQPSGRLGEAEEVADVAAWLCSDQAGYVSGQAIAVDGGVTAI